MQNNVFYGNVIVAGRGGVTIGSSRDAIYEASEWKQWTPQSLQVKDHDLLDSTKNVWFRFGDNVTILFNVLLRKIGDGDELTFVIPEGPIFTNLPPLPDGLANTNYASGVSIRNEDTDTLHLGDANLATVISSFTKQSVIKVFSASPVVLVDMQKYRLSFKLEYKALSPQIFIENARATKGHAFNF